MLNLGLNLLANIAAALPPAVPTVATPNATVFVGEAVTVTASTTDTDLDRVDWVLDANVSEVVIATDSSIPYSQVPTIAASVGVHTLTARAWRRGLSTDSAPISFTVTLGTLGNAFALASGTFTHPANVLSPAGVRDQADLFCRGAGGGGKANTGGGGGGAFEKTLAAAFTADYPVTVGTSAIDTDGGDTSIGGLCIAKGGKSRTNGGQGGQAAAGTGTSGLNGGDGVAGTANQAGGAGAGDTTSGSGTTVGEKYGGISGSGVAGRIPSGGGGSTTGAGIAGGKGWATAEYVVPTTSGCCRVIGRSAGRDTAIGLSRDITLPSGSGGRIVIIVSCDGNGTPPTLSMTGYTALTQINEGTGQVCGVLFHRIATGSDPVTISTSTNRILEWKAWRITDPTGLAPCGIPEWSTTSGSSTNADPPSRTPSGGSGPYMYIACAGWDGNAQADISATPAGYTNVRPSSPVASGGTMLWTCEKFAASSASDDPGAFTSGTEQWWAATVSIGPVDNSAPPPLSVEIVAGPGDSITDGVGDSPFLDSYRYPANTALVAHYSASVVTFLWSGYITGGQSPTNHHMGADGARTKTFTQSSPSSIIEQKFGSGARLRPTIVCLATIGTNDCNPDLAANFDDGPDIVANFLANYRTMCNMIRTQTSTTRYVVGFIVVPAGPTTAWKTNIINANLGLPAVWDSMEAAGFVLKRIPAVSYVDPTDYQSSTSVHLNHTGYGKLGAAVATQIQALLADEFGI